MREWLRAVVVLLAVTLTGCAARSGEDTLGDAERALEERVLAPCCWRQPLRDHESELASSLRAEIRRRLQTGERSESIEDDLVRRYGDQIRAMPEGSDPRWIIVAVCAALAGVGLHALSRLVRKPPGGAMERRAEGELERKALERQQAYEARLEDELSMVD